VALATGEYIALLDHDDTFASHALYFIAQEIAVDQKSAWIYFDWDYITEEGQRYHPNFKPGPNLDLFLSVAFMADHAVYDINKVREIGGFRVGYEGSQDHDLGLRMLDVVEWQQIRHIPHILYHWRSHIGSVAGGGITVKPYAEKAGVRAVQDYLNRHNVRAVVTKSHNLPGYRIRYLLPDCPPQVTIIIPTRNRLDLLRTCIASILDLTSYKKYDLIVVDNESDEPQTLRYLDYLQQEGLARVLRYRGSFNHSALNNFAVQHAKGELICLLNNDTEVISESWLSEMVSHAIRPDIGIVGAQLWYQNNTLQHAGVHINDGCFTHIGKGEPRHACNTYKLALPMNLSAVTGACMVMRKHIYEQVGGLNQRWLPVGFNDVELCFKIRQAGWRVLYTPYAELYHYESQSRGKPYCKDQKKWLYYINSHWPEVFLQDPFSRNIPASISLRKSIGRYQATKEKLFFLHIPKTAGSSFRKIVAAEFPGSGLLIFPAKLMMLSYESEDNALTQAREYMAKANATFSHFRFGMHRLLGIEKARYITLLRDPVQRAISHYNYLLNEITSLPESQLGLENTSIAEMFRKGIIPGNLMTEMICGGRPEAITWDEIENGPYAFYANFCGFGFPPELWRGEVGALLQRPDIPPTNAREVLEIAMKNIREHFYFVGLTENMADVVSILGKHLGWEDYSTMPEVNVNTNKAIMEVDAETRSIIEDYNRLDIRLYEFIRSLPGGYFINFTLSDNHKRSSNPLPRMSQPLAISAQGGADEPTNRSPIA
jgi:GT2 family glycosyltransferase